MTGGTALQRVPVARPATAWLLGGLLLVLALAAVPLSRLAHQSLNDLLALSGSTTGPDPWWGVLQQVFFPLLAACWLASVAFQVASYRRSSGERRQQLKWLLAGAATRVLAFQTPVAVAAATLAAAALFTPVRRRVQRIVDRRFNRARYDADQTIAAFSARLQDTVDTGAIRADLLTVVGRSLEPAHQSVWIAGSDR